MLTSTLNMEADVHSGGIRLKFRPRYELSWNAISVLPRSTDAVQSILHVYEVIGSNLGPKAGYPDGVHGFSQCPQLNTEILVSLNEPQQFPLSLPFINHPTVRRSMN